MNLYQVKENHIQLAGKLPAVFLSHIVPREGRIVIFVELEIEHGNLISRRGSPVVSNFVVRAQEPSKLNLRTGTIVVVFLTGLHF